MLIQTGSTHTHTTWSFRTTDNNPWVLAELLGKVGASKTNGGIGASAAAKHSTGLCDPAAMWPNPALPAWARECHIQSGSYSSRRKGNQDERPRFAYSLLGLPLSLRAWFCMMRHDVHDCRSHWGRCLAVLTSFTRRRSAWKSERRWCGRFPLLSGSLGLLQSLHLAFRTPGAFVNGRYHGTTWTGMTFLAGHYCDSRQHARLFQFRFCKWWQYLRWVSGDTWSFAPVAWVLRRAIWTMQVLEIKNIKRITIWRWGMGPSISCWSWLRTCRYVRVRAHFQCFPAACV